MSMQEALCLEVGNIVDAVRLVLTADIATEAVVSNVQQQRPHAELEQPVPDTSL